MFYNILHVVLNVLICLHCRL